MTRSVEFGYFLIPNADDPLLETARRVEELGLEWVGIQDHPYQRRYVDTWALMGMIAASTTRLRVFPDVTCLPLRPPAVLAKSAATIDRLSEGRFELGLGAGAFWDAIVAYGGLRRGPGESLEALEEAITVIRMIWSGERSLRFDGEHYHLAGAQGGPVPAHDIGIWLGAYGPRSLDLTGRVADGWVPSFRGDLVQLAGMVHRLDEAIERAGRPSDSVRRVINVSGAITSGASEGMFNGPVDRWVDDLTLLATEHRFDTFIFWGEGDGQLDRFGEEVAPAVRERLAGNGATDRSVGGATPSGGSAMNEVVDETAEERFAYREGDHVGELVYRTEPGRLILVHTGVPRALGGRGIAGQLVQAAVDRARASGETIAPWCPYTRKWLQDHADDVADLTIDWSEPPAA